MIYKGYDGEDLTEQEFRDIFGSFQVVTNSDASFHVVRLKAIDEGVPDFGLRVVDSEWNGIAGVSVVWGWPGGSTSAPTGANGWVYFRMYENGYYHPPEAGPYYAYVDENYYEEINGIGMLFGTYNHFNAVLKQGVAPPPDDQVIQELLDAQIKNLEVAQHIQNALDLLQEG